MDRRTVLKSLVALPLLNIPLPVAKPLPIVETIVTHYPGAFGFKIVSVSLDPPNLHCVIEVI